MTKLQEIINCLFGIGNETSAPIIITFIIFILGYLISYLVKFIENFLKRKSKRKLFFELLKEISKSASTQALNFKEFADTLVITYEKGFKLRRVNINHLSNLNKLDFETIHDAYFTGIENWIYFRHSRDEFNIVWSGISKLTYWEAVYRDEVDKFINKFNSYESKRNDLMDRFRIIYDTFIQSVNGKTVSKEYGIYINGLQSKILLWLNVPNNIHFYNAQHDLVLPLIEHNKQYPEYEISLQLNNVLLEASYYYDNLKRHLENYRELFLSYEKTYETVGQKINNYLRNYSG